MPIYLCPACQGQMKYIGMWGELYRYVCMACQKRTPSRKERITGEMETTR